MSFPWLLSGLIAGFGLACASLAGPSTARVTEITLERDCFGCPVGTKVILRRDGTATLQETGKARHGTADRTLTGTLDRADFERLARQIQSDGFFELEDEYADPLLADGAWVVTTAVGDGRRKTVQNKNAAGPPELAGIEATIESVRGRIGWVTGP